MIISPPSWQVSLLTALNRALGAFGGRAGAVAERRRSLLMALNRVLGACGGHAGVVAEQAKVTTTEKHAANWKITNCMTRRVRRDHKAFVPKAHATLKL